MCVYAFTMYVLQTVSCTSSCSDAEVRNTLFTMTSIVLLNQEMVNNPTLGQSHLCSNYGLLPQCSVKGYIHTYDGKQTIVEYRPLTFILLVARLSLCISTGLFSCGPGTN